MMRPEVKQIPSELLTYQEAADRCKVSERFIRNAVKNREIRAINLGPKGKLKRISTGELERWWSSYQTKGCTTL